MNERNRGKAQSKRRSVSLLDEVLERRMLVYALAAGATLAGASAAQAKVVFTPNNTVLKENRILQIDLNNDGVTDVTLHNYFGLYSYTQYLYGRGAAGNLATSHRICSRPR